MASKKNNHKNNHKGTNNNKKRKSELQLVFPKEHVVGTFMIAGVIAVILAFYELLVEYFYMPRSLAMFVMALLFFLLSLMFSVAEAH